ncbi:hypothetical protein D3C71_1428000 [compost metagenome]
MARASAIRAASCALLTSSLTITFATAGITVPSTAPLTRKTPASAYCEGSITSHTTDLFWVVPSLYTAVTTVGSTGGVPITVATLTGMIFVITGAATGSHFA